MVAAIDPEVISGRPAVVAMPHPGAASSRFIQSSTACTGKWVRLDCKNLITPPPLDSFGLRKDVLGQIDADGDNAHGLSLSWF